ncbi:uncharacterized protein LOC17875551 [Capsella rubella]|uniref:uncharacterized protein LOC17875551 n=1 Tax=Capsella rubella TaxID=81985 RepID=UPI000CD4E112|nr:uncharacterized protein LOC17875551 [Capsella rubella]
MRRREEKRREFHEALLQTLYPPSSPPSLSSSPSPVEVVNDEPFDVTLINPEDYLKISSTIQGEDNENGDESGIAEKPSRAQRKRLRKKMLKEEEARRKKVMIGPLLPSQMLQNPDGRRVGDASGSIIEEDSDSQEEEDEACQSKICSQPVRLNATEKKEEKFGDSDKTRKVKKRREAKKLAKDSVLNQNHIPDPRN